MLKSQIKFWVYLFLFNLLLFLPAYLMDAQATFFPDFLLGETFGEKWELIFRRQNNDIFRFSFDFLALILIVYLLRKKLISNLWSIGFFLVYFLLFIYQLYQGAITSLFQSDPLFYSDYFLISEGLPIIIDELAGFQIFLIVLGILLLVLAIFFLFKAFVKNIEEVMFGTTSKVVVGFLLLITLLATINYRTRLIDNRLAFPIISYFVFDNVERSQIVKKDIENFDFKKFQETYDYSDHQLKKKPNIFLLFIESYGKIVYDHEVLKNDYLKHITSKEATLSKNGWNTASTFSTSPVTGGRSWLAYTSFMLGIKLDKQATYSYLVSQKNANTPSFFHSLQASGYYTYRLSVLIDNRGDIPYDAYSRFYGFNEWIHRKDMDYHGKVYGWGPAPDDQYSLNFANAYMRSKQEPFALFYINLNTHNPFDSPTEIVDDWRTLGTGDSGENDASDSKFFQKPDIIDYAKSIQYQFDYITAFILKEGNQDDIFILIGDHQPPILTGKEDSFETPIHIISKDSSFIDDFVDAGFNKGLKVNEAEISFKHEGLYSLIMREFIRNYGKDSINLPVYLPEGFLMK